MITNKVKLSLIVFIQLFVLSSIVNAITDSNPNNNVMNFTVNVVDTREFKVDFVPIDEQSSTLDNTIINNIQFVKITYPLSDTELVVHNRSDTFFSEIGAILDQEEEADLINRLFKEGRISKKTHRVVGIVPDGWLDDNCNSNIRDL